MPSLLLDAHMKTEDKTSTVLCRYLQGGLFLSAFNPWSIGRARNIGKIGNFQGRKPIATERITYRTSFRAMSKRRQCDFLYFTPPDCDAEGERKLYIILKLGRCIYLSTAPVAGNYQTHGLNPAMPLGSLPTRLVLELAAYVNAGSILAHFSTLSNAGRNNAGDNTVEQSVRVMDGSWSYFQVVGDKELEALCSSAKDYSRPARLIILEMEQFLSIEYK